MLMKLLAHVSRSLAEGNPKVSNARHRGGFQGGSVDNPKYGAVQLILARLVSVYFLSHNTIHSTSRVLFILPAEQPLHVLTPYNE